MSITLISAGLMGLLLFVLSANVIRWRVRTRTSLGDGGDVNLMAAIRAQANLTEYAPLLLILIGLLDYSGVQPFALLSIAVLAVVGRYLHGWGIAQGGDNPNPARRIGMLMTFTALVAGSVAALLKGYGVL